jgi:hypothetical protein
LRGRKYRNSEKLCKEREIYLTIGLTRNPFQGRIWPVVVGFHITHDLENIEIDYNNL